jgi:hypothetical protein
MCFPNGEHKANMIYPFPRARPRLQRLIHRPRGHPAVGERPGGNALRGRRGGDGVRRAPLPAGSDEADGGQGPEPQRDAYGERGQGA